MNLDDLKPAKGATKRRKIIGRGVGSGHGKTSTRGHKGDKSRGQSKLGFEGGQTPLHRRLPKQRGLGTGLSARGFNTGRFKANYAIINLGELEQFEPGTVITPEFLIQKRVINDLMDGVKILADGEFSKALTIRANKFSKNAQEKITTLGGKAEQIGAELATDTEVETDTVSAPTDTDSDDE